MFQRITIYYLIVSTIIQVYESFDPCKNLWEYSPTFGSCYYMLQEWDEYSREEARIQCRIRDNESDMLYIDEPGEEEFLYKTFWQYQSTLSWIFAIYDPDVGFTWNRGDQISDTIYLKFENYSADEKSKCLLIENQRNKSKLGLADCQSQKASVICKKKGPKCQQPILKNAYAVSNKTFYGKEVEVHCEAGYIQRDRNAQKLIKCVFDREDETLKWEGLELIDCVPNSCNAHPDFPKSASYSNVTLYSLGEIMNFSCPDGQQIRTRCIWDKITGFPKWDFDGQCSDACPNEWIYDELNRICYSQISTNKVSYYKAEWLCSNENYVFVTLIGYDTARSLLTNLTVQDGFKQMKV